MIHLAPLVVCLIFLGSAPFIFRAHQRRDARRIATAAAAISFLVAGLSLALARLLPLGEALPTATAVSPPGLLAIAPLVTSLIAVIAAGIAPLSTHKSSTFARMMLLFACAEAFLVTSHPLILTSLWGLSSLVAWTEFRQHCHQRGWHRVFALYHVVSFACFAAGSVLIHSQPASGAAVALLLFGIAIREGVIPVHSWFPRLVEHAPMGLVVAFFAPQLGVYAQLELLFELGLGDLSHTVARVGAITAVLGAMLGVVQVSARRKIAYLIVSQTGLVAMGLENHSTAGLAGALLNWQVLALATSGFAMGLSALEARRGPLTLTHPHGNFSQTPRLATLFLLLGFSSVGFPLTLGFVAEDLLVQGTVGEFPLLSLCLVIATAFNGISVLRAFFYLFTGTRKSLGEPDLSRREGFILGVVVITLVATGLVPGPLVAFENPAARTAHTTEPARHP